MLPSFKHGGTGDGKATPFQPPAAAVRDQAWSAIVNVAIEPDGLVRRYPFGEKLDGKFLPSMGALLAGQVRHDARRFMIDFGIRPDDP